MSLQCPKCQSDRIGTLNSARKAGGTVGTVAGAIGGLCVVANSIRMGATVGWTAGPIGATCGGLAGAIVGGLIVGGIAGGTAGAALGEVVDETILDNFQCYACGNTFSHKPVEAAE